MTTFDTWIDAPRGFMDLHRTTKVNVRSSDFKNFSFIYNLETKQFLQYMIDNVVVELEEMPVLTPEECKELEYQILLNHGNHINCDIFSRINIIN